MFGQLTPGAIEALLHEAIVGRIDHADSSRLPGDCPVTYAYDGRAFYAG
jgi:nitroimidazol reductase NimA-like FMN-containing flavoprotein (pyridoxamine 5'-phosphate oxidase superfamily)